MESYDRVVKKLEEKIDASTNDHTKLAWLNRYFKIVLPEYQKEKYKKLKKSLDN